MEIRPLSLDDIKQLVALFEAHRLVELEVREQGVRIRLAAARWELSEPMGTDREAGLYDVGPFVDIGVPGATGPASAAGEGDFLERGWLPLHAPMTGTFYRRSAPDEPSFAEVGGPVEEDQIIGLIEAMKIFSEIRSETSGTLMELPIANGQMVQAGQVLAWVLPDVSTAAGE